MRRWSKNQEELYLKKELENKIQSRIPSSRVYIQLIFGNVFINWNKTYNNNCILSCASSASFAFRYLPIYQTYVGYKNPGRKLVLPETIYHLSGKVPIIFVEMSATIFTSIDACGAYHNVQIEEGSRDCTAFISWFWTFRYICMPFGLSNVGSVYSRMLDLAMAYLPASSGWVTWTTFWCI